MTDERDTAKTIAATGAARFSQKRRSFTPGRRVAAPVMYEPSSSGVTVAGSTLATSAPRRITQSVSDRPISSSRSAEMRRTARPLWRASRSWSHTAACAPTSTPRVGWAAISKDGSATISRPTISFCWLPPDNANAETSTPGVRTSKSWTTSRVRSVAPRRSTQKPCSYGSHVWWPSIVFSHSGLGRSSPCW